MSWRERGLAGVLCVALRAPAATVAARPRAAAPGALEGRLRAALARPALQTAFVGFEVRRVSDGQVLATHEAGRGFTPASTMKLLTTAAALDALGPDERVRTTLESAALVEKGRLRGDLYLVGRGDANLSGRFSDGRVTAAFEELADGLAAAGVSVVEGRLVGHEGAFAGDRRGRDWSWDDLVWWYGAEVSALSFNDNCVDLKVAPGDAPGRPAQVTPTPVSSYYRLESTAVTGAPGSEDTLELKREPGGNLVRLSGSLAAGAEPRTLNVALEDPARWAATVFSEVLRSKGIVVLGGLETSSAPLPPGARVLATHEGRPLREELAAVNKPSQNLHAELLLRRVGLKVKGEGTAEAGLLAVRELLERAGAALEGTDFRDGSGLSFANLVTPRLLTALLLHMQRQPHAGDFRASLPVAGVDGTLKSRLKGTRAEGRVQAKTGAISHVNALAGYATLRSGEPVVFAVMANHQSAEYKDSVAALDAFVRALVE